jgi:hypothetical protein
VPQKPHKKKRKTLSGVRVPLPAKTGGKHKVKTAYNRKAQVQLVREQEE